MANGGSQNLFRLIQGLTNNERLYFKKYAAQYTGKDVAYLKLFDALVAMERFDNRVLQAQFKNLAFLKNYLFRLLLNVLGNYYNNPANQRIYFHNLFIHALILENKGFTKLAIKELQKGETLARKVNDHYPQYLFSAELYRLQESLVPLHKKRAFFTKSHEALQQIINHEMHKLRFRYEYRKLALYATQKTNGPVNAIAESEIDFELLKHEPVTSDLADLRDYYKGMLTHHLSLNEPKDAYVIALKYLAFEKKQLRNGKSDLKHYSEAMAYCSIYATEMRNIKLAEKHLEDLRRIKSSSEKINLLNISRYTAYRLIMFCTNRLYAKGAAFSLSSFEKFPHLFNPKKLTPFYHPRVCYSVFLLFMDKQYDECIAMLNQVNIVHIRKNAPYSYKDLEMLRLMMQVELGNYQLLPNMVRALSEKLRRGDMEDEFTKILLRFFSSCAKGIKPANHAQFINALNKITATAPRHDSRYTFMGVMPYQDWIRQLGARKARA